MDTTDKQTPPPATRYTAQSCHELGYAWVIDAPASLDAEDVERLQGALTAWSDQPEQGDLYDMLAADWFCNEHGLTELQELGEVIFTAKIVHGDRWSQGFQRED